MIGGGKLLQSFSSLFQFRLTSVCVDVRTPSVPFPHNYDQSFHNGTSLDSRRVGLNHALSREESNCKTYGNCENCCGNGYENIYIYIYINMWKFMSVITEHMKTVKTVENRYENCC